MDTLERSLYLLLVYNQLMESNTNSLSNQFNFVPVVENESKLIMPDSFVVCGMGGSHLAAGILKIYNPSLNIYIHRDYGLPQISAMRFKNSLFIASSYSGNTEEVLDFAEKALSSGYNVAAIAIGGKLIDFAKENKLPYIQIPDTGIQPRNALGFSLVSLSKLIEGDEAVEELHKLGKQLDQNKWQEVGKELATELNGKIPVVYSSRRNLPIAYNWKIKFNESAKIPAFYNVLPELNHNEMTGFDVIDSTKSLSDKFYFVFLEDSDDEPRIMRRMEVMKKLYEDRALPVKVIQLAGASTFEKIFNSLMLADWVALELAKNYGTEPVQVPMVEEFKKLIS